MKGFIKDFLKSFVFFVSAFLVMGLLMGAFTQVDFTTQISGKPTTIAGYGLTDAASNTFVAESITAHAALASDVHGIPLGGEFASASGAQTITNKTLDDTNSITGDAIDSGTVAEARIAAGIARSLSATRRESVTIAGEATTTVTFVGTPVPSTIDAAVCAINGLVQVEGTFTRTSAAVIESTAGTIPVGAVVTVYNLE